jgi:hypothetical protein
MADFVRRVVTGHDEKGNSIVLSDGPAPVRFKAPGSRFTEIWNTAEAPAPIGAVERTEPTERRLSLHQDKGGTVIRFVDFEPPAPGGHGLMHRTRSIDYGILLEGEITLVLSDGLEVPISAGDVVVQRGTDHAWANRSNRVARMAFILVDGAFDPELDARISKDTLLNDLADNVQRVAE